MKCDQVQKMLPAFLEGVLSKTETALVEKHKASCEACRVVFEEYRNNRQLIADLEEVEPPSGFAQKIMAQVHEEETKRGGILRKLFFPLYIKVPAQAVAVAAVAVLAIQAYRAVGPPKQTAIPKAETAASHPGEDSGAKEDLREKQTRPAKKAPEILEQGARIGEGTGKEIPASPFPGPGSPVETRLRKEAPSSLSQTPAGPGLAREAEKAETSSAGKRVKMEMKDPTPAPSREAASLQKIAPIGLTLRTEEPGRAGEKVQSFLRDMGGGRIAMIRRGESEIVTAEMDAKKLPLLLDQLKTLGDVAEKTEFSETTGPLVSVRIEIYKK